MDPIAPPVATPSSTPGKRKRLPARRIADWLRSEIVAGHRAPGSQLPTRAELERMLGASSVTIQRALDELRESGFVEVRGSTGTFVAERPPHRYRVALVFPTIDSKKPTLFWQAIRHVASELEEYPDLDVVSYFDIDRHKNTANYKKLLDDIRNHRLAGLVMVNSPPSKFEGTPVVDEPGLARANIGQSTLGFYGVGMKSYRARVLKRAADEGRKRLALIHSAQGNDTEALGSEWRAEAEKFGIELRPQWVFPVHAAVSVGARAIAHALLAVKDPTDRPDAIMIQDDHLVEAATQGIYNAGVRTPEDVSVFAHCNFPVPPRTVVPVARIGFDMNNVLRLCIGLIEDQLSGKTPGSPRVEPVFAEELEARSTGTVPLNDMALANHTTA